MEGARQTRILAVDDCEELLEWLNIDLETRGFEVLTATGGEEALAIVATTPIDIMVLDIMMPGSCLISGFLEKHPTYMDSCVRLDMGLSLRDNGKALKLAEALGTEQYCPPLQCESANGNRFPKMCQPCRVLMELAHHSPFSRRHGKIRLSFDGLTVCQLISSNSTLGRKPAIFLFTAGGLGVRGEREAMSERVGAEAYVLKSEYYDRLLPLLQSRQIQSSETFS